MICIINWTEKDYGLFDRSSAKAEIEEIISNDPEWRDENTFIDCENGNEIEDVSYFGIED